MKNERGIGNMPKQEIKRVKENRSMKWKKLVAFTLALSMFGSTAGYAAPMRAEAAETNTDSSYQEPWDNTMIPGLLSKTSSGVDKTKFTHQEWTGNEYTDVEGR